MSDEKKHSPRRIMSDEIDDAYAKALVALNTLRRAAEAAEGEVLRLRAQNDDIAAVLRAKGLDRRDPEPTPDIVGAFKGENGEWRTHSIVDEVPGSRIAYHDGVAVEAIGDESFQFVDIDLPTDEARRKWVEAAPCWDLPRTERVTVEGVGLVEKK